MLLNRGLATLTGAALVLSALAMVMYATVSWIERLLLKGAVR